MPQQQSKSGRVGVVAVAVALGIPVGTPAWGQGSRDVAIVADSPYANSYGPTIYKGQTYYPYGSNEDYGGFGAGLPIFRSGGRSGLRFGAASGGGYAGRVAPPVAGPPMPAAAPYLTNRTHEPGDGWRYPLYYNPATATYFYYPVAR